MLIEPPCSSWLDGGTTWSEIDFGIPGDPRMREDWILNDRIYGRTARGTCCNGCSRGGPYKLLHYDSGLNYYLNEGRKTRVLGYNYSKFRNKSK